MIWRMYFKKLGDHVHCRLFCGTAEGALGLCGKLTMRSEEFTDFTKIRRVIPMDFRNEEKPGGGPEGDLDYQFARLT